MVADIGITPGSRSWLRLARMAKLLSSLTLVWLGIEGAIGVVAGILAGSIALVAFGLDSAIEGLANRTFDLWYLRSRRPKGLARRRVRLRHLFLMRRRFESASFQIFVAARIEQADGGRMTGDMDN